MYYKYILFVSCS